MVRAWRGSRPVGGVRVQGDTAELWQGERQVGVLFRWTLEGRDGGWIAEAIKYRLIDYDGGEARVRFLMTDSKGTVVLEVDGDGTVDSVYQADNETHREYIHLKGGRLWLQTGVPPTANGSS